MALKHIEIEQHEGKVFITNEGKVQMFAGDPGTTVFSTVELTMDELKKYINNLISVHNILIREE